MRSLSGSVAVGLGVCLVAAIALAAGCGNRTARTQDEAGQTGAAGHRLPPPSYQLPRPVPPAAPQMDARLLATLAAMAQPPRNARFVLDDWRLMYHWWNCPYKPHAVPIITLDHVGGTLTTRTTTGAKFTHMNRRELKAKGYRPCPHCRPDLDPPARVPDDAYREPQRLPYEAAESALRGTCPAGGRHVPGTRDINGRLRCARCGQAMD